MEMCFYQPGSTSIIDLARPDGRSQVYGETLAEIQARHPGAQYIPYAEASTQAHAELATKYCLGIPTEITKDRWMYALEVLPPCRWTRDKDGERFYVSELIYCNVASWYVRIGRRFFEINDHITAPKAAMYAACRSLTPRKEA